jgi:glutamate racemase
MAHSLADYLYRHPEMRERISQNYRIAFHTTDDTENFNKHAALFYGAEVKASHVEI